AANRINVQNKNANDFPKPQGDNRQVISAQPQRWNSYGKARQASHHGGGKQADEQENCVLRHRGQKTKWGAYKNATVIDQSGGSVAADRVETGMANRKLTCNSVN